MLRQHARNTLDPVPVRSLDHSHVHIPASHGSKTKFAGGTLLARTHRSWYAWIGAGVPVGQPIVSTVQTPCGLMILYPASHIQWDQNAKLEVKICALAAPASVTRFTRAGTSSTIKPCHNHVSPAAPSWEISSREKRTRCPKPMLPGSFPDLYCRSVSSSLPWRWGVRALAPTGWLGNHYRTRTCITTRKLEASAIGTSSPCRQQAKYIQRDPSGPRSCPTPLQCPRPHGTYLCRGQMLL